MDPVALSVEATCGSRGGLPVHFQVDLVSLDGEDSPLEPHVLVLVDGRDLIAYRQRSVGSVSVAQDLAATHEVI